MRLNHILFAAVGAVAALAAAPGAAEALDGKAIVAERCVSCHDVTGPAPAAFAGVLKRRPPDLFYAGSKFNRSWLVR